MRRAKRARLVDGPCAGHEFDIDPRLERVVIPKMNDSWGHYDAWDFFLYKRLPHQFDDGGVSRFIHA